MIKELYIVADGGLGNQLFQYSFAQAVAQRVPSREVHFDTTMFRLRSKHRSFLLDQLIEDCSVRSASPLIFPILSLKKRCAIGALRHFGFIAEPIDSFEQAMRVAEQEGTMYVHGYWQSVEVATHGRAPLQEKLRERYGEVVSTCCKANDIDLERDVAIHVRRGDYVGSRRMRLIYETCDENYYLRALAGIRRQREIRHVYVFSDDIEWNRTAFKDENFRYVDFVDDVLTEFALLSSFRNIVISNSTFSWWAALCDADQTKTVIAPEHWQRALPTRGTPLAVRHWQYSSNSIPEQCDKRTARVGDDIFRRLMLLSSSALHSIPNRPSMDGEPRTKVPAFQSQTRPTATN